MLDVRYLPAIIQKNQEKANRVFAGLDYSGILMLP